MSEQLEYKLKNAEIIYFAHKKSKTAKLLVLRHCLNAILIPQSCDVYFKNAYALAKAASDLNPIDLDLKLLQIYVLINQKKYKEAKYFLDSLGSANSYKNKDLLSYVKVVYLIALLKSRTSSLRSVGKYYKILESLLKESSDVIINIFLADIAITGFNNELIASDQLNMALEKGSHDPLIYINLIKLIDKIDIKIKNENLISLIKWSFKNNIMVASILLKTNNQLKTINYTTNSQQILLEQIYQRIQSNWALHAIAQNKIKNNDTSIKALSYYKEALENDISIPFLDVTLLKTLCVNRIENIPLQIIPQLISNDDISDDSKAFLYHLILTNTKYKEFKKDSLKQILELGIKLLLKKRTGIHYNSIYKKIFEIFPNEERLLKLFSVELFQYEVYIPERNVKYIWIQEAEKQNVSIYPIENNYINISAATPNFKCYCFGQRQHTYLNTYYKITKRLNISDFSLYEVLYKKGYISENLIIALSKGYLKQDMLNNDSVAILKMSLAFSDISNKFRNQICLKLGSHYATLKENDKAYAYFLALDISEFNNEQLEQLLIVLLSQNKKKEVINILNLRYRELPNPILFKIIKKIQNDEEYNNLIIRQAFHLLINTWYDKALLKLVLKQYQCPIQQWIKLRNVLNKMGINETELDKKIILESIYVQYFDEDLQKIFLDRLELDKIQDIPRNKYCDEFIHYLTYQVVIKSTVLLYDTVIALENIYLSESLNFIAYTLSCLYILHGVITLNTFRCIEKVSLQMEEEHILPPIFENIQDSIHATPYIEKNMPFEYRTLPKKEVYLCYKFEDNEIQKIKMNYVMFGIYQCVVPIFSCEQISYYFEEDGKKTDEFTKLNRFMKIKEDTDDTYFKINNAIVYEHLLKYDVVEDIIAKNIVKKTYGFELM